MTIGVILFTILGFVLGYFLSSMIFWGLGLLVCTVFTINYTWTFLHGLVCALVFSLLRDLFGGKSK